MTFLECNLQKSKIGFGGTIVTYQSELFISGHLFNDPSKLEFDKFIISIPLLLDWTKHTNIKIEFNHEDSTYTALKSNSTKTFKISKNIRGYFSYSVIESFSSQQITLKEEAFLILEVIEKSISLIEFFDLLKHFLKFLAFIQPSGFATGAIGLRKNKLIENDQGEKKSIPLKLFVKPIIVKSNRFNFHLSYEYKEIETIFESLIQKWYDYGPSPAINLLMNSSIEPNLNNEINFLNICFAIESFHREFIGNKVFDDDEFKRRKNIIKEKGFDKEIQNWIMQKMKYANEPSFRTRLKEFNNYFDILFNKNSKQIIDKIIETRNYLVHRDQKTNKVLEGIDLLYIVGYLEGILRIKIFESLGLKPITFKKKIDLFKEWMTQMKNHNERLYN